MTLRETYINATMELLEGGADFASVTAGLQATLKERGHGQLQRSILEGLLREYAASKATDATVTIANTADAQKYAAQIKAIVGEEETVVTTIDETLVGGYVVESQSVRHDASFKTALLKLYRRITT